MEASFSTQLGWHIVRSRLPMRRVASRADIPAQTLFNWANGTQPRWHPALPADIRRLARALGLDEPETDALLRAAGCLPAHPQRKETPMDNSLPKGWFPAGTHPDHYDMGVETDTAEGRAVAFIRSRGSTAGFGTLMQTFAAREFRGNRLRFAADVQTANVLAWAGLWMRCDGSGPGDVLAFDNMQDRPISGTTPWARHAVVLDVDETATQIALGVLLSGPGEVRVAGIDVAVVPRDVPTTGSLRLPSKPVNLSFSE
jgi:hypothetical protein